MLHRMVFGSGRVDIYCNGTKSVWARIVEPSLSECNHNVYSNSISSFDEWPGYKICNLWQWMVPRNQTNGYTLKYSNIAIVHYLCTLCFSYLYDAIYFSPPLECIDKLYSVIKRGMLICCHRDKRNTMYITWYNIKVGHYMSH